MTESINHYSLERNPWCMMTCSMAETRELFVGTHPKLRRKTMVCHLFTKQYDYKLQDAYMNTCVRASYK